MANLNSMAEMIIKKPNVYITPDLPEGDQAVIHIISPKQTFLNLKFEEGDLDIPFKPFLSADNALDLEIKPKIKKAISKLEDRIVHLGAVYTCYHYLLTVKDNEVYLLSVSLTGLSLGYGITKEIAEKVDIKLYAPVYQGPFTQHVISVFTEDVFVQKR
jgi:hypothetical protein